MTAEGDVRGALARVIDPVDAVCVKAVRALVGFTVAVLVYAVSFVERRPGVVGIHPFHYLC